MVVVGAVVGGDGGWGGGLEPGVVVLVLFAAEDDELGEEGFEVLAGGMPTTYQYLLKVSTPREIRRSCNSR